MFEENFLGTRIKALRQAKSLTLQQLGEVIGSGKGVMSNIENGKKGVSVENLIALAEYFNVSVAYLLGETDEPARSKIPQLITMQDGKVIGKQPLTPDIDFPKGPDGDYKFEAEVGGKKIQLSFSKETPKDILSATITAYLAAIGEHKKS
jgi:transcriptional regulator with XRE-family HTH domain